MLEKDKTINMELNNLIREVIQSGGSIYLVNKSNPEYSIRLTEEVKIVYFVPMYSSKSEKNYRIEEANT